MKIIVVLVAVVMATTCWTGVTAQDDVDSTNVTEFRAQFGNLDSETVERMVGDLEEAGGSNNSVGFNPLTQRFFPIPFRRCEEGPFRRYIHVPGIYFWPPVYVYRCKGRCPNWSPCIARKRVTRTVLTIVYKWILNKWIPIGIRKICVKDEKCCECQKCSDITSFSKCRKTKPCPDTTNPKTFCYWKPFHSWVKSASVSPSIWGSCACCKKTPCEPLEFFDERRCQCKCISKVCPGHFVQDPDTCKCICPHKDINCGPKKMINPKTCKCICKFFKCFPPRIKKLNKECGECVCPQIKCNTPKYFLDPRTCKCTRRGAGR